MSQKSEPKDASDEGSSASREVSPILFATCEKPGETGQDETGVVGSECAVGNQRNTGGGIAIDPRGESVKARGASQSPSNAGARGSAQQRWKYIGMEDNDSIAKERLVQQTATLLEAYLLEVVEDRNARRKSNAAPSGQTSVPNSGDSAPLYSEFTHTDARGGGRRSATNDRGLGPMSPSARDALLRYVSRIASMYRDIPFHNFEHAGHATASAAKLVGMICAASRDEDAASAEARTFGLSADPLARFAIVFACLVHDVDHRGVPNAQLVKENDPLTKQFGRMSVAEKWSIALAWNLLMEDGFQDLRSLMFEDEEETGRFKHLLDTAVLATDIADEKKMTLAKERWREAFQDEGALGSREEASLRSLRMTLVIEQIMQASDVAHTMQHWETFKRWNGRLCRELSKAYKDGRRSSDPLDDWHVGEIGFFDHYVLPLATRLKECGVLGSAGGDLLDCALENRQRMIAEDDERSSRTHQHGKRSTQGSMESRITKNARARSA